MSKPPNGSLKLTRAQVHKLQILRFQRRIAELEAENSALTLRLLAVEERSLEAEFRRELGDQPGNLMIDMNEQTVRLGPAEETNHGS